MQQNTPIPSSARADGQSAAELATLLNEELYRLALIPARMSQLAMALDAAGRIVWVNAAFVHTMGYTLAEARGAHPGNLLSGPETDPATLSLMDSAIKHGEAFQQEMLAYTKAGEKLWFATELQPVHDETGKLVQFISVTRDVPAEREAKEQLAHLAYQDSLTGLPNRTFFREQMEQCIRRAKRHPGCRFAVLYLDLDGFKLVNDSLGHAAGDKLLCAVAERLRGCLRSTDAVMRGTTLPLQARQNTVARMGGDEFTVLLEEVTDSSDAARVAERILKALARPVEFDGSELTTTASVGIVIGGSEYDSSRELARDADLAMYRAKAQGRNRYAIFDARMHESAVSRLHLENNLRRVIDRGELLLHYQPVLCLATRELTGFEALVRWRREGRLVSPAAFIPVAEDTGLIIPIGAWVLREACRQLAAWRVENPHIPPVSVSVNLSQRQLSDPAFPAMVAAALAEHRIDPGSLVLEITERMVMDESESAVATLAAIRELGVKLALDDFGTGYSSLSCLHKLPIDELKIDRSFIDSLSERRDTGAVVQAIIEMAHKLGIRVVAEGVETPEQTAFLQTLECDAAQGYHFAEPLDPIAAETYLRGSWRARVSA